MGWMRHHAIVVSSWNAELLREAHDKAHEVFITEPFTGYAPSPPSEIVKSGANSYTSFFVPPDGSKEGWDESERGDERRDRFVAWLRTKVHEDGSTSLRWVEVQYGDEEKETRVVRDSDHR